MRILSIHIFLILCLAVTPALAQLYADQPPATRPTDLDAIVTLSYENDIFSGEDNNYTNGVRASYISPENDTPVPLRKLADLMPFYPRDGHTRWNLAFGQNIYTPDDITNPNPPLDDQPYAGWLYGTAGLVTDVNDTLDVFQVTLGMVGPAALGEPVQKTIHHLVDSPQPQGWDTQLHNEPGVVLSYQRKWRNLYRLTPFSRDPHALGFDLSPSIGAHAGNIYTDAGAGAVLRFGSDLPSDYGPPLIRPNLSGSDFFLATDGLGWYAFAGVEGRAVGRNIFLDGNSFDDTTRHVDKEPFIGNAQLGLAITYHDTRIAYTHVFETREFATQRNTNQYGALTMSMRF